MTQDFLIPISSGLDEIGEDEQERLRANWRLIQRDLQPRLDEMRRCRDTAALSAQNYYVVS